MYDIFIIIITLIGSILFPVLASIFLRKRLGHEHLKKHNEVAGFIFAIVGVIYAVMMAFVVLVVWEEFQDTNQIVEKEASTIAAILALSDAFEEPYKSEIKNSTKDYLNDVVNKDWKAIQDEIALNIQIEKASDASFNKLRTKVFTYRFADDYNINLTEKLIDNIEELASARRMRFFSTNYVIPTFMWFVLIVGAILVVSYSLLFSSENLWAQMVMISFLSVSIALVLLLIYSMNHPYVGIVKVEPDSYQILLESMK